MKIKLSIIVLFVLLFSLAACGGSPAPNTQGNAPTDSTVVFDPDSEADSLNYADLATKLGAVPKPSKSYRVGVVLKFFGNQYWQLIAEGIQKKADELGIAVDIQAAATEVDREGQLAILNAMIDKNYDAILISPQTDENLVPAVEKARQAGILVLNVTDAVLKDAEHWSGPNQYDIGVRAANYFAEKFPEGGQVAIIEGQVGVYAATQRTQAFKATLEGTNLEVVASVTGEWDLQMALDIATNMLEQYPELKGIYCNNDIMALGAVEAMNTAGKLNEVLIIGTDGIDPAYDSIRAGEMTATIDSFPTLTGEVAMEVALRLLEGQKVPRAVYSPQNLITIDNIDNPLPK